MRMRLSRVVTTVDLLSLDASEFKKILLHLSLARAPPTDIFRRQQLKQLCYYAIAGVHAQRT